MKKLARRVDAVPSFLSRIGHGLAPALEDSVHWMAAELGIDAESLLVQAEHLTENVRSLLVEHPQRVVDILRTTFRHHDETLELGQ